MAKLPGQGVYQGESLMLASPKGEANVTDDRTAQPIVAK